MLCQVCPGACACARASVASCGALQVLHAVHAHTSSLHMLHTVTLRKTQQNGLCCVIMLIWRGAQIGSRPLTELAGPIWKSLASCAMSAGWPAARPSSTFAVTVLCDLPCSTRHPLWLPSPPLEPPAHICSPATRHIAWHYNVRIMLQPPCADVACL